MRSFTNLSPCGLLKSEAARCAVDVEMDSCLCFAVVPFIIAGCGTNVTSFAPLSAHQGGDLCLSAHRSVKRERGCLLCRVHSSWKSRMLPLLRGLRQCTVRNSRKTQSGGVRHCSKHSPLLWTSSDAPSVWEGSKSGKGKVAIACAEVESQTVGSSRALTAHFSTFCGRG